tara:strand:- start:2098 stop:2214 length:117 start_codon:yes stop_codon:yes gene_type:complete
MMRDITIIFANLAVAELSMKQVLAVSAESTVTQIIGID